MVYIKNYSKERQVLGQIFLKPLNEIYIQMETSFYYYRV